MKTIILILSFTISLLTGNAQTSKNIAHLAPGGLIAQMTPNELITIKVLSISGAMDARDFKTMRDMMPNLTTVDLWNIAVTEYTGNEGTSGDKTRTYTANTLPDFAFSNRIGLTSVYLPVSITSIGDGAFEFCDQLSYTEGGTSI